MPSFPDSIFLFILALLLFGPKKLPMLARELGKWVGEFRRASNEFKMQMEEELRQVEQADREKQIAAMEAAAPVAPLLEESASVPSAGAEASSEISEISETSEELSQYGMDEDEDEDEDDFDGSSSEQDYLNQSDLDLSDLDQSSPDQAGSDQSQSHLGPEPGDTAQEPGESDQEPGESDQVHSDSDRVRNGSSQEPDGPAQASGNSSLATAGARPAPLPIATSGRLSMMPPATGLPTPRTRSDAFGGGFLEAIPTTGSAAPTTAETPAEAVATESEAHVS